MTLADRFRNMGNRPDIMGCEVARAASLIADFLDSFKYMGNDTYSTTSFGPDIAGLVSACQTCENEYEDIHMVRTLDLHTITVTGYGLDTFVSFILWHKDAYGMNWDKRIAYYYDNK